MLPGDVAIALMFDFYGLAFFVLGVSVLLNSEYTSDLFYTRDIQWLAGFGFLLGLAGFLAGKAAAGNLPALGWPILLLRTVGFFMLLEYARRLWNQGARRHIPPWPFPALALAVLGAGAFAGPNVLAVLDATERYFICLPVSWLIAWLLHTDSRSADAELARLKVRPWLTLLCVAFFLFGLLSLTLVLRLRPLPWLPTNADFRAAFGFPVQLVHTALACTIALSHFMLARLTARFVFRRSVENAALIANEEKYRTLFERSSDAILTFDHEHFVEVNQSCVSMFGYGDRRELLGLTLRDLSPPRQPGGADSKTLMLEHIDTALDNGTHRFEWLGQRRDGSTFAVEFQLTPMKLPGRGELMQAIVRDIESHKRSERELKMHRENLQELVQERTEEMLVAKVNAEKANAAKSEFLSRMSHELRTPLNAIIGFGQLLELECKGESRQQQEYLGHIVAAGNHLLQLVNELLDLSRIESGKLPLSMEAVNLVPLLEEAIQQITPPADQLGLHFSRHYDTGTAGPSVSADKTRLLQVLLNLLGNAAKYNRPGGEIAVRISAAPGERVRVSITDTGHGIADADLDRLFRPFERLRADDASVEGTGIGLALTKHLTEAMQGSIGVDSREGSGSTFWIELRRSDAVQASAEVASVEPRQHSPVSSTVMTLLLVEDNPLNVLLLERFFDNNPGYRLFTATDAWQGLALAASVRPDLVLMDINLPGIDGFAALERLQSDPMTRHIPVVAISANAMPEQVARGHAAGFTDYLVKPINLTDLLGYLDRLKSA